jgi:hypothetical protein
MRGRGAENEIGSDRLRVGAAHSGTIGGINCEETRRRGTEARAGVWRRQPRTPSCAEPSRELRTCVPRARRGAGHAAPHLKTAVPTMTPVQFITGARPAPAAQACWSNIVGARSMVDDSSRAINSAARTEAALLFYATAWRRGRCCWVLGPCNIEELASPYRRRRRRRPARGMRAGVEHVVADVAGRQRLWPAGTCVLNGAQQVSQKL